MTPISPEARANVHLIDHPLVQHKLTLMRNKTASTNSFRRLLNELSSLMAYEVTRDVAARLRCAGTGRCPLLRRRWRESCR